MFYYLTVTYNVYDLCLSSTSYLFGPFATEDDRNVALHDDLTGRDLACSETVNVTLLKIEDGELVSERSFIADEEEFPNSD